MPKKGEVFCSNIISLEPEGMAFSKPVTVLLSHSAAEDGAYADYYDLTVQRLAKEPEDLETERLSQHKDLSNEILLDFHNIHRNLPLAKATIKETCTLVVASRIRSEQIFVQPDELSVYAASYGNESEVEIFFPLGTVETECSLTIQVIPPIDALNINASSNGELICFPTVKVSGRDEPFLRPVEVELCYSSDGVANLDENFLPVGDTFPFSSKYGFLLRTHKNLEGNPAWQKVNENVTIERCLKNKIKISFSVDHFCRYCAFVKGNQNVDMDGFQQTVHYCTETLPSVVAVCLAVQEMRNSRQKVYAVLAPKCKISEVEEIWGSGAEDFNTRLKDSDSFYFCAPLSEQKHLCLPDNDITFFEDKINSRYNFVDRNESVVGQEMRFTREQCVDNKHFRENCVGKCEIISKKNKTIQADKEETPSNKRNSFNMSSSTRTSETGEGVSVGNTPNSHYQITEASEIMKKRCELFEKEVKRFSKIRLYGQDQKNKAAKFFEVAGPTTTILVSIGGGIAIAMGVATLGITSFIGAAIAASGLVVMKIDTFKHKKLGHISEELKETGPDFVLSTVKEAAKELCRIFEDQLFRLEHDKDVTTMACCAVNLMFKLKEGEEFSRNNLVRKVLLEKTKRSQDLKTKRNNKKWQVPDVFQKPGLRKEIGSWTSKEPRKALVEFQYYLKNPRDLSCDADTYGYRGQILEMVSGKPNEDMDKCTKCFSGEDTTVNDVTYFTESDIDRRYTENCVESSQYQPYHCLVQCPYILENVASQENSSCLSLKNYVGEMYSTNKNAAIKPVYRSHSPRKVYSLRNTDISGSDFSRVNFDECDLTNCTLTDCTIMFGNLKGVKLRGSQFKESYMCFCNLVSAEAQSCEWTTTRIHYCYFEKVDLRGGVNVVGGNHWKGTTLNGALTGPLSGNCESRGNEENPQYQTKAKKKQVATEVVFLPTQTSYGGRQNNNQTPETVLVETDV